MRPRWSFLHIQQEQPQSGCRNHCCATGNSRFLLKPPKKPAPPEQQNERLTPQTCCALQTPAANSPVPGAPHPSALMMLAEDTSPTGQRGVLLHLLSPISFNQLHLCRGPLPATLYKTVSRRTGARRRSCDGFSVSAERMESLGTSGLGLCWRTRTNLIPRMG